MGIVGWGSYVPFNRLQRSAIGGGRGERAVASFDEDSVSMGVEAARDALAKAPGAPDTLLFATTSPPYVEKLNAATIQAALDLPDEVLASDLTNSTRAGVASLLLAEDLSKAGRSVLAIASDVVVGAPSGGRESMSGDAAVAFVLGADEDSVARVIGRATLTEEALDVWRSPGMPFAKQWEDRFGAEIFVPLFGKAAEMALKDAGIAAEDLDKVVLDGTNARSVGAALRQAASGPESVADNLAGNVGRTGTAHAGLMLANVLDQAMPGDKILVAVGADGVDAVVLEVTDKIAERRPSHSVASWIASSRNDLGYTNYLKWRGILPFEPPRRPDPPRPAAPPMRRADRWKFAFVGSRCTKCGSAQLPPQRVCVICQATDQSEPEPFADAECKIATYTVDRLAYSLQPPTVVAVVDFDKGGRYTCQLTDVDPDAVTIGDELELTFRRFYTADGVHNYFWKARPRRQAP